MKTKTGVHIDAAAIAAFNQGRRPEPYKTDAENRKTYGLTYAQEEALLRAQYGIARPITSGDVRAAINQGKI
jgi:hypothetical protein